MTISLPAHSAWSALTNKGLALVSSGRFDWAETTLGELAELEGSRGCRIMGDIWGQELQGHMAMQLEVFRFVPHTPPPV
jgi:hypothetical protein